MSGNSEVEASRFARSVEEIEKLIRSGGDNSSGYPLAAALEAKQARLDSIRGEGEHVTSEKKEKEQKDRSAISQMVELEAKLNKEEKEKYSQFLSKGYFTKSEIKDLEQFYANGGAYDRLSNDGKAEMSRRIEEGIRRGDLSREDFSDNLNRKNDDFRNNSYDKEKSSGSSEIYKSGNYRNESSILEDLLSTVKQPDSEAKANVQPSKVDMPDGLAALAKLSPVQETDVVVVPQTERGGQGQSRGG